MKSFFRKDFVKWLTLMIIFLVIVQLLFYFPAPAPWLVPIWEATDLISFVGTILLGYIAFHQNRMLHEEIEKREKYDRAVNTYVLFSFLQFECKYLVEDKWKELISIERGFNGNKAFWKYGKFDVPNLHFEISIQNISDFPATNLFITKDKINKYAESNVLYTDHINGDNDKRYILPKQNGLVILNIPYAEIDNKLLTVFLSFQNPFGATYSQPISIRCTNNSMIQIDAQAVIDIQS